MLRTTLLLIVFLTTTVAFAQDDPPIRTREKAADDAELAAITVRGREIAAYDRAAWVATDEVQALKPLPGSVQMYIGRKTAAGWEVAFGKLNDAKDTFLLAYVACQCVNMNAAHKITHAVITQDKGDWLVRARAIDVSRRQLKVSRPYNMAILSATDGKWFVYAYPAQTVNKVYPTGGDYRFLVSSDGTKILETHRMHMSILESDFSKDIQHPEMTFHTAVLDDAPEDMDVANVLFMGGVPMLISGKKFTYQIEKDGTAHFLMTTAALLKVTKQ